VLEVELKARADLEATRARLEALGKRARKHTIKEDVYYGEPGLAGRKLDPLRDRVVRVRIEDGHALLTAKRKAVRAGVEESEEIEVGTDDGVATRRLLDYMGWKPVVSKRKETRAYEWAAGLTVELNEIAGLGAFVEVERLLPDGSNEEAAARARDEVKRVLRELGIEESAIEPRPYMVLLREAAPHPGPPPAERGEGAP
jgi:adenylate cyclase class 2